jgi:ABC-2 type transport system permease protein
VLTWWTIGIAILSAMYGSVLSTIDDLIEQNEGMAEILEQIGISPDDLRNGFVTFILSMLALVAGAGVIQSMLRPRTEEVSGRAEPVLASGVSRRSWLGSQLLLTALAAPVLMVAAALALSFSDAAVAGEMTDLGGTVWAGLARTPALWAMAGLGVLLYGLGKRYTLAVWVVFAIAVVIFMFGELLKLPDMALNLSPVRHVTHTPLEGQGWLAIVVLLAIAVLSTGAGIAMFDRRDVIDT